MSQNATRRPQKGIASNSASRLTNQATPKLSQIQSLVNTPLEAYSLAHSHAIIDIKEQIEFWANEVVQNGDEILSAYCKIKMLDYIDALISLADC